MSLGACSLARAPLLCRSDRTRIFLVRRTAAQYVSPKAPIRSLASSSFRRAEFYGRGTRTKEPYTIRTTAREIASEPIRTFVISSRYIATMVVAAVVVYGLFSQTVPVTGRRSFNVMSDGFVRWWNQGAAEQIIRDVQRQGGKLLPEWDPRSRAVRRAMERLIPVSGMQDLDWEVHVIADDRTANAFVLPGGKVFVHSGIVNVCGSEDALAAVLGHEIAHNTANHAGERMTQVSTAVLTTSCLFLLGGWKRGLLGGLLWNAVGAVYLNDLLLLYPMSRKQETEADYVGLMMMAEACYDPRKAVGFWQKMEVLQKRGGGMEVPEVLSTHPANRHRIENMQKWMDKAMETRSQSDCRGTSAFASRFREAIKRRQSHVEV